MHDNFGQLKGGIKKEMKFGVGKKHVRRHAEYFRHVQLGLAADSNVGVLM